MMAPSNFRGKNWRKIGKMDICTNPFKKKLPLMYTNIMLKPHIDLDPFLNWNQHPHWTKTTWKRHLLGPFKSNPLKSMHMNTMVTNPSGAHINVHNV